MSALRWRCRTREPALRTVLRSCARSDSDRAHRPRRDERRTRPREGILGSEGIADRLVFSAWGASVEIDRARYEAAVAASSDIPGYVVRLKLDSYAWLDSDKYGEIVDIWVFAGEYWFTQRLDATPQHVLLGHEGYMQWMASQRRKEEADAAAWRQRQDEEQLLREAELSEAERRRTAKLALARSILNDGTGGQRQHIPVEVRYAVHERDGGRCVVCASDFDLQFDHVIPVALGGSSTIENLQILCAPCNRRKGATLG